MTTRFRRRPWSARTWLAYAGMLAVCAAASVTGYLAAAIGSGRGTGGLPWFLACNAGGLAAGTAYVAARMTCRRRP
jgi:hypothetical protein